MPAGLRCWLIVITHILLLLCQSQTGTLARIEAEGDDLELLAGRKRHDTQRANKPVEFQAAKHRAFEIDRRQQDRLLPKKLAELYHSAVLVAQHNVRIDLRAKFLIDPDFRDG